MEKKNIQQEILLITKSNLSKRNFSIRQEEKNQPCSAAEILEQACWNGMLEDLISEVLATSPDGKKLLLWQIQKANSFLHIDLCESPETVDYAKSVDPYFFMAYHNNS